MAANLLAPADLTAEPLDLSSLLGDKVNALFDHPIEVVGFCDEEGVRFQSTFLGSSALAGTLLDGRAAHARDAQGQSVLQVLDDAGFAGTEASLQALAMDPEKVSVAVEVVSFWKDCMPVNACWSTHVGQCMPSTHVPTG